MNFIYNELGFSSKKAHYIVLFDLEYVVMIMRTCFQKPHHQLTIIIYRILWIILYVLWISNKNCCYYGFILQLTRFVLKYEQRFFIFLTFLLTFPVKVNSFIRLASVEAVCLIYVTCRQVDAATSGDCMQRTGWREINGKSCIGYDNAQVRDIFGRHVMKEQSRRQSRPVPARGGTLGWADHLHSCTRMYTACKVYFQ